MSGTLSAIGPPDLPPPVPLNVIADFGGGAMMLAFGVVAALVHVARTGRGEVVDAAMVDGAASLATYIHSMRAAGTWTDARASNVLDGGAPFYRCYSTADGRHVAVGAIEPQFYAEVLAGLGLDGRDLPDQLDRSAWPHLTRLFASRFATRTLAEWCAVFSGRDACVSPVLTMAEAPQHPHHRARRAFVDVGGVVQPAPVVRFGDRASPAPTAPPGAGQGGLAALRAWGVATPHVADLVAAGVVVCDDYTGDRAATR
jgi:alpha-methylacyl-CoA racemase